MILWKNYFLEEVCFKGQAIVFKCRDENCIKEFPTKFNPNTLGRNKRHAPRNAITTITLHIDVQHFIVLQPQNINKKILLVI